MTFTDRSASQDSLVIPQFLHREATVHVEEIAKHDPQAVLLDDAGDAGPAERQVGIAYKHIAKLLEVSRRALNIQL